MIVKADGDLNVKRLKGAIAPHEVLVKGKGEFREVDPKEGFSVRNFQIQAAKIAPLCDIVVYGEDEQECKKVAVACAQAQKAFRELNEKLGHEIPLYNTFICKSKFVEFEENARHLVVVDSRGQITGQIMDFFHQERVEMAAMTKASEIGQNVWLGPTPDLSIQGTDSMEFDLYLECSDAGKLNPKVLKDAAQKFEKGEVQKTYVEIPSSGSVMPPTWSMDEANDIVECCRCIYSIANGIRLSEDVESKDHQNDSPMPDRTVTPRKVLFHCADGYTESSMFAIAYYIYATGFTLSKALVTLHVDKGRNFFAYPSDMALLRALTPLLLAGSPALHNSTQAVVESIQHEKKWLDKMDGSLPSRITDYMYLGNLGHVNNPDLLTELGIGQILSVGETATWTKEETEGWTGKIMAVCGVQDNGIDPLTGEFERCLEFLEQGRTNRTATLVHCRVGVSRSATICIAEVMRSMKMSYPRAYCYVRARRLNVIIQPHLRFSYELLKWEEALQRERGEPVRREREWAEVAREIAAMNRPYSS